MTDINVFIFRRDLRIEDNLALNALIKENQRILPIFIFNPKQIYAKNNEYFSNNCVQFMIESLKFLEKRIHINYFEDEDDTNVLKYIQKHYNIKTIAFNKDYTPFAIKRDAKISAWCNQNSINIITEEDYTLFKMGTIKNNSGNPYQIFTPFYKNAIQLRVKKPSYAVLNKVHFIKFIERFDKDKYYITNNEIAVHGGRESALLRLKNTYKSYSKTRDYPALDSTTKLSAYIKFGCVSIREAYYSFHKNKALQRELIWREFYANILFYFPQVLGQSFRKKYDNIKWSNNKEWFAKWCMGKTGFPLVDAGMQQLNKTGWMHNRVRMIVAMFLTKDLLIDWRWGEKYFATKLVDYDPSSNNGGWQWSASTGTDSQPYFRIFSPELQIKKYDKNYEYITKWNPDFNNIKPIIDHKERAKIAISTFKKIH